MLTITKLKLKEHVSPTEPNCRTHRWEQRVPRNNTCVWESTSRTPQERTPRTHTQKHEWERRHDVLKRTQSSSKDRPTSCGLANSTQHGAKLSLGSRKLGTTSLDSTPRILLRPRRPATFGRAKSHGVPLQSVMSPPRHSSSSSTGLHTMPQGVHGNARHVCADTHLRVRGCRRRAHAQLSPHETSGVCTTSAAAGQVESTWAASRRALWEGPPPRRGR